MEKVEDLIIIGSGPAGYTAAIYTAREDFNPLMITGIQKGGQLTLTTTVDNYPGFPEGVMGPYLMELFRKQAERFGARFIDDNVMDVDFSKRPFKIMLSDQTYFANSIIISTGASAKWLNLESEQKLIGRGVSSCATCDGVFFRNKEVIVVGGGDTAMEDSSFLSKFAKNVTIVHRRDKFRASKIMQKKALSHKNLSVIYNTVVEEVLGTDKVTGVKLKNLKTGEATTRNIDGLFVAIGYIPNTSFLKGKLELDSHGYIITKDEVKTNIEGIFAAGDVSDRIYRQAVTAAGSGAKAALEVREYIHAMKA